MDETIHRLEVASLDLGADVRAVGLELIDAETREPITGSEGARVWGAIVPALAGEESWCLDFFAHLERVREYCRSRGIAFREPNTRTIVVSQQAGETLTALFERFAGETFGVRAGDLAAAGDADVESGLAQRGVDGYHTTYSRYLFCAVCDFENGFLTLLSDRLGESEVIRRAQPALEGLEIEVAGTA